MATLTVDAAYAFDINTLDFNWYLLNEIGSSLQTNINETRITNGVTYADVGFVNGSSGGEDRNINFYGSSLVGDMTTLLTGGTVEAIVEIDNNNNSGTVMWVFAGLSLNAGSAFATAQSASTADELALLAAAFAGDDTITLSDQADTMNGYAGNDTMYGNAGNDTLDGGTGADTMIGGTGNDIYYVDNTHDVVTEFANEGTDLVYSSVSLSLANLGQTIENLTLLGTANITALGNDLANVLIGNSGDNVLSAGGGNDTLTGNAGNDRLNGGAGADVMIGGTGNDTYYVDNTHDVVIEFANEGTDLVYSSVSLNLANLGQTIENLALLGTTNITAVGNDLANVLTGNSGDNVLSGGAGNDTLIGNAGNDRLNGGEGADTMIGGTGDDIYYVNHAGDVITELANEGNDLVNSSTSLSLSKFGQTIENLTLVGSASVNASGNNLANTITGNGGNNLLSGGLGDDTLFGNAGNDVLNGGVGSDTMIGGSGADRFLFNDADFGGSNFLTADRIVDFSIAEGDKIDLAFTDAVSSVAGDQSFTFIGKNAFSHTAGELRYASNGVDTLIMGDTNGDGLVDFAIKMDGVITLHSTDFIL